MDTLDTFKAFIKDKKAAEMFIRGQAGTGKTTDLARLVQFCIDNDILYVVCAYTHTACDILRSKLPKDAVIMTLHAFLKKRPTINEHATAIQHIQNSRQQGEPEKYELMMLDEFSQLGERDYSDIGTEQWLSGTDVPDMKALYIGDTNQTTPVGDVQAIYPSGKYNVKLTKIWRQADGSPLLDTLAQLVSFIEGDKPAEPLKEHSHFIRGIDLTHTYVYCNCPKILLAWTNRKVQELNALIKGRDVPWPYDEVYSPTTRYSYIFADPILPEEVDYLELPFGDEQLIFGTKYKTLEHLVNMSGIQFALLTDTEGHKMQFATVFGHYNYKIKLEELGSIAVESNIVIEKNSDGVKAREWAFKHKNTKSAKDRAKAWRDYYTFKNCVICIDFPYAMTIHKSQGSTYHSVFIDTQDLGHCANKDYMEYLKLTYVAISRASDKVYTN